MHKGGWTLGLAVLVAGLLSACGSGNPNEGGDEGQDPPGDGFTTRLAPLGSSPAGLAWSGTRLVAVGRSDTRSSEDGLVWSVAQAPSRQNDVAWDGTRFVAVGDLGSIETSLTGLSWNRISGLGFFTDLRAVAGSGSVWVAVGEGGAIYSSPEGTTWTSRTSAAVTTQQLNAVVWTGSQFVAVGNAGTVITSPDGATWTLRGVPTSGDLSSVAASSSMMVVSSGTALFSSPDADNWTPRGSGGGTFTRVVYGGGKFVAVGYYQAATSSDGTSWTEVTGLRGILDSVIYAHGQYLALGPNWNGAGTVFSSADGLDWATRAVSQNLVSLVRSPSTGRMVAVGGSHASQTSLDGISWEFGVSSTNISQNYPFLDVVWSPSAGGFMALVQVGANQYGYKSTDGKSWTEVAYAPCYGKFAASEVVLVNVGTSLNGACLATSTDGASWTSRTVPAGLNLRHAFWTGDQFVAVGSGGALATSPDGASWTARTTGLTSSLTGVAASPTLLVAVGDSGKIVTSSDGGASWEPRTSGTSYSLKRVTWTGSEFYAVGGAGTLLRSTDGITWSPKTTPFKQNLSDVLWLGDQSRLVLVGDDGLTATSP